MTDNILLTLGGIGLKPQHFDEATSVRHGWYEVHAENYLVAGGPLLQGLLKVREQHALSLHCVGMSPGSADGIDEQHVRRIKALCERVEPALVSDHLAWSRWQGKSLNDLLPLPYTAATLAVVCENIDRIQHILNRSIAIENPSLYVALPQHELDEAEFLQQLCRRTGCQLLLDVNNLVVSANNVALDVQHYLRQLPAESVVEYHLAGHKKEQHASGVLCIDDHGSAVDDATWALYADALRVIGARPTLIEWDTEVPSFAVLQAEADKADCLLRDCRELRRHA